jgi:hypothetical protein
MDKIYKPIFNKYLLKDEINATLFIVYFDFCKFDYYYRLTNYSFGCINYLNKNVCFNRDFVKKGYKLCNLITYIKKYQLFDKFWDQCENSCYPKCNFINSGSKIEVTFHDLNKTVLDLIPKKSPRIAYIETLKTDFNKMILKRLGFLDRS